MTSSKLIFSVFTLSFSWFLYGCSPEEFAASDSTILPLHHEKQVFQKEESQSLLLVGLRPYLGRETTNATPAKALRLKSVGNSLVLKDATGLVHKSSDITIAWRKIPLVKPEVLVRQVAGPFASY